ncbi:hypothetical protein BDV33DRAFT_202399 [Aspergillus novoparasiticus]|uniref:Uncharacterized protein n=1 Tax=Aspergillus novoparasiticus TaxID=986946 RepID=A0A5N6EX15_9EURO|nr:hypothetical protein BDV33DRAFT_202399 [Aspergillus novoparasiticus]
MEGPLQRARDRGRKERIRREILPKSNREIVESDVGKPTEEKLITLLRGLGSDLSINAFALNWRYDDKDRTWNTGIEEANYLTGHVVEHLSIYSPDPDPPKIPFYLTSTEFTNEPYGKCAQEFKRRLGLPQCDRPLFVLRNVVTSPFPTDNDFISTMVDYFRSVVEDGIILAVELEDHAKSDYIEIRESNPQDPIFLKSSVEIDLQQVVSECERGSPVSFNGPEDYMPFYLYGSGKQWHISHMLRQAPNATFSAGNVKLDDRLASSLNQGHAEKGAIRALTEVPETSMQPFPTSKSELPAFFFFQPDKKYKVKVWDDPNDASAADPGLLEGSIEHEDRVDKWRDEFSQIGKKLEKRA